MFEEYQELAGVSVHKLIKPSQTRWLSLAEGVSRVLEQWDALLYYFQTCSDVKSLQKVRRFVSIMEQPMTKAHLFFLEEALTIFTDFNKRYQSSDVMIHCLHDDQLDLFRLLALNFMKPPAVKALPGTDIVSLDLMDASLYLADEDLVISKKAKEAASKLTPEEREIFYDSCRRFYRKGAEKVKCRLRLRDPVLMGVRMLSPADGTSMTAMSVSNLAERFPQVILPNELLGLQREWQRYQAASATTCALAERTGGAVDRYWSAIGSLKDGTSARFPLLFRLAKALLVLPHSGADIERHFSALDSEMCATRNRMGLPLLNSLLTITCNRGETTCLTFRPTDRMRATLRQHVAELAGKGKKDETSKASKAPKKCETTCTKSSTRSGDDKNQPNDANSDGMHTADSVKKTAAEGDADQNGKEGQAKTHSGLPEVKVMTNFWRCGQVLEYFLPSALCQSRTDGRNGSSACTLISALVAAS